MVLDFAKAKAAQEAKRKLDEYNRALERILERARKTDW